MTTHHDVPGRCARCGTELVAAAGQVCIRCAMIDAFEAPVSPNPAPLDLSDIVPEVSSIPSIGDLLGDCKLGHILGEGGMGIVFEAENRKLNRTEALKFIKLSNFSAQKAFLTRSSLEVQAIAALQHDNIVKVYQAGEQKGHPYFSMEFIKGSDLKKEMENQGQAPLPLPRAAKLMSMIARAIHHAHARGILHRDLKPANILLDENDKPYVTDFGLAKFIHRASRVQDASMGDSSREAPDLTSTGQGFGTIGYTSPEQALGNHSQVTTASDLFSLGAIFYQMISGQRTFPSDDVDEFIRRAGSGEFKKPSQLNVHVDADLDAICFKCLEPDPERRANSAEDLARQLEHWLKREPLDEDWRQTSIRERVLKWIERHPVTAALSAVVAITLILGLAGVIWQWHRAEQTVIKLRLQRAEDRFASDNAHVAIAELARLVRDRPDNRVAAERLLNALRQRVFLLPSTQEVSFTREPFHTTTNGCLRAVIDGMDRVSIRVSEIASDATLYTISNAHKIIIRSVRLNRDGTRLVTASGDRTAQVWDTQSKRALFGVSHLEEVAYAEFSLDGTRLLTASRDHTAHLWDALSGQSVADAMRHLDSVNSAHFGPDGKLVVTASDDETARVWDAETGRPISEPARLGVWVDEACIATDSRHVVAFTNSTGPHVTLKLSGGLALLTTSNIEAPTNHISLTNNLAAQYAETINFIALSPDQRRLATASTDKTVRLWDARTFRPLSEPLRHSAIVNCVQFSPDGLRLVSSATDRTVRIWDLRTGLPLSDWIHFEDPVAWVRFSPDGRSIVTSGEWRWDFAAIAGRAPPWLAPMAEAVAGLRIGDDGIFDVVPAAEYLRLQERLRSNAGKDHLTRWASSWLEDDTRPHSHEQQ